jgi:RHH-type transcriptional regulator, rel operon repressor / antitoxin RelB
MEKSTVTVRVASQTKRALDEIAEALDRDRTYIVNEALSAYIEIHEWQCAHIRQGIRDADAGRFASEGEVGLVVKRLRRKPGRPKPDPA